MAFRPRRRRNRMPRRRRNLRRKARTGIRRALPTVYSFKRVANLGTMSAITNAGAPTALNAAYSFKLSDIPNNNEFTALYDQYCIKGIKISAVCTFSEAVNAASGGNNTTAVQGFQRLLSVIDYDDATALTGESAALQYQNVKITNPLKQHARYFKPAISMEINEGLTSAALGMKKNQWIDCSYPNVPHYGIKYFQNAPFVSGAGSANCTWTLYATYYVQFKNVR